MRQLDTALLQQLSGELASLCGDMVQLESSLLKRSLTLHEANRRSARNLAHYLALRRHDVRKLQSHLASLDLSSLGRTEGHVLDAFRPCIMSFPNCSALMLCSRSRPTLPMA
jgi:pyruvate kinase